VTDKDLDKRRDEIMKNLASMPHKPHSPKGNAPKNAKKPKAKPI